jgi:hypothetical protein
MKTDYIPLSRNPTRFLRNVEQTKTLNTEADQLEAQNIIYDTLLERVAPTKVSNFRKVMDSADGSYTLLVQLDSLKILEHPLITNEFRIAKNIENLMDVWNERKRMKIANYLTNRLAVSLIYIKNSN